MIKPRFISITLSLAVLAWTAPCPAADRGRVQIVANSVVTDLGTPMRGVKIEAWKNLSLALKTIYQGTAFWSSAAAAGANAARMICFDAAEKTMGQGYSDLGNYGDATDWASLPQDARDLLTLMDNEVNLASQYGMYILINYHDPGVHPDTAYWQRFWELVAPRYASRTHVFYELSNEPIPQGDPVQYWPAHWFASQAAYTSFYGTQAPAGQYNANMIADQVTVYQQVRAAAPGTHLVLFSFPNTYTWNSNAPGNVTMRQVVQQASGIDWSNASVGFHPYHTGNGSAPITDLKSQFPVINTEANLPENVQAGGMDGEQYGIQTMERLGISWFHWEVEPDPIANPTKFTSNWLGRLLPDASAKDYWWQKVDFPGGGTYNVETNVTVNWASESGGNGTVDISFSGDGGSTFVPAVNGLPNTGSAVVMIPVMPSSTHCRVKVSSSAGKAWDVSGADFTILTNPAYSPSCTYTFSPTPTPPPNFYRVNCGGGDYTDTLGNLWMADSYFSGGDTETVSTTVTGTSDPALFLDSRRGTTAYSYTFPVPLGQYQVTLKFADFQSTAANTRVTDILINGSTVLSGLDVFALVGKGAALDEVFNNISPSGGQVTVTISPTKGRVRLWAVSLLPQAGVPTPSATPWQASATRTSSPTATLTPAASAAISATPTASRTPTAQAPAFSATPSATRAPDLQAPPVLQYTVLAPNPFRKNPVSLVAKLGGNAESLSLGIYTTGYNLVERDNLTGSFGPGLVSVPLDVRQWPRGILFVRVTAQGHGGSSVSLTKCLALP